MIVVFALLGQSLFIVQRVAQTQEVKGKVRVQRGGAGEFAALTEGALVQNGDVVLTGAQGSAQFRWQDGTRWKLLPNSRLVIKKSLLNSLKRDEVSRFDLEQGQMLVRVVKNLAPNSRFEVKTPGALVVVRGAILSVSAQNGATDVNVLKGRADVSESDAGESKKAPVFSAVSSQNARISAAGVQIGAAKDESEFLASPTMLRPALNVESHTLKRGITLIKGQTEVGNRVSINGENVQLLGNGTFLKRMNADAKVPSGGWKIESTDKFGATASVYKSPVAVAAASLQVASAVAMPVG